MLITIHTTVSYRTVKISKHDGSVFIALVGGDGTTSDVTELLLEKGSLNAYNVRIVGLLVVEHLGLDKKDIRIICANIRLVANQID